MRSKFMKVARTGASFAFVLGVAAFATGCDSACGSCASPCAPVCPKPEPVCAPVCAPVACAPSSEHCGPMPAGAVAGEAWCCVFIPPVYSTVSEQVCTQPACARQEWVPPVYETRQKQVCTCPEQTRTIPIPAVYNTVEECIEVCPARTEWQRVDCATQGCTPGQNNECFALVTIPATYEKRQKQVCVQPEACRTETIPAVYETQTEQVQVACGYNKDIPIPAVYETVTKQVCNQEGRWEWQKNTSCAVPMPQVCNPCAPGAPAPVMPTAK